MTNGGHTYKINGPPHPLTEPEILSAVAIALDAATDYTIVQIEATGGIVAALAVYSPEISARERRADLDRVFKRGESSNECEALCFVIGHGNEQPTRQYPVGPPLQPPLHGLDAFAKRAKESALCQIRVERALAALSANG